MSPFAPSILLFEKSPCWESELKRRFEAREVLVRPCRSPRAVIVLCRQSPGSVLVADLTTGAADVLRLLESLISFRLAAFPVLIAPREWADLEWPARELGAVDFVTNHISGDTLADICRRALASRGIEPHAR